MTASARTPEELRVAEGSDARKGGGKIGRMHIASVIV